MHFAMDSSKGKFILKERLRVVATANDGVILNFQSFSSGNVPSRDPSLLREKLHKKCAPVLRKNITYFVNTAKCRKTTVGVKASFTGLFPEGTERIEERCSAEIIRRGIANDSCCMIIPSQLGGASDILNLFPIRENTACFGHYSLYKSLIAIIITWLSTYENLNPLIAFQMSFEFSDEHPKRPVTFHYAVQFYTQTTSLKTMPPIITNLLKSCSSSNPKYLIELELAKKPQVSRKYSIMRKAVSVLPVVGGVKTVVNGIKKVKNNELLAGAQAVALGVSEIVFDLQTMGLFSAVKLGRKALVKAVGKGLVKNVKERVLNDADLSEEMIGRFISIIDLIINNKFLKESFPSRT